MQSLPPFSTFSFLLVEQGKKTEFSIVIYRICVLFASVPYDSFSLCQFIANPIKRWGYVNEGRKAMMLLKHKLLDSILLRRTKLECAADLALPPSTVRFLASIKRN